MGLCEVGNRTQNRDNASDKELLDICVSLHSSQWSVTASFNVRFDEAGCKCGCSSCILLRENQKTLSKFYRIIHPLSIPLSC